MSYVVNDITKFEKKNGLLIEEEQDDAAQLSSAMSDINANHIKAQLKANLDPVNHLGIF